MSETNANLARQNPESEPSVAPVDYAKKTDELLAREGEETGKPMRGWEVLNHIKDFERMLGIEIDDGVRNEIVDALRTGSDDPKQALLNLKASKYDDPLYRPVAELLDKMIDHYDLIEDSVNSLRSSVAESVENIDPTVAFENKIADSLKDSLFPRERGPISDEKLKAASKIRNIFYDLADEVRGVGIITSDPDELQAELDKIVGKYGFDPTVFNGAVKKYLSLLMPDVDASSDEVLS